jgi:VanZ family protein
VPSGAWRALALIGYAAVLVLATLSDFELDAAPASVAMRLRRAVLVELDPRAVVDALRNATLFAGWGLVWGLTAAPAARPLRQVALAAGSGALLSAAIETAQLASSRRTASALDVAVDAAGATLGALAIQAIVALLARSPRPPGMPPAWLLAGSYAVAALLEAAIPLAREPIARHGAPAERLSLAWAAFVAEPWSRALPADVLLFAPAGVLAAWALRDRGVAPPRAALAAIAAGAVAMAAAELAHAPLGLRLGVLPLLAHAGAIAAGALVARALAGRVPAPAALGAYAALLLAWDWRPFWPEPSVAALQAKLASGWWQPLMAHYLLGGDLYSVADVLIGFALFMPLGAWLACRAPARRGRLAALGPAALLAAAGELGQLVVEGRHLDVTDPMVEVAGAVVGWLAMRRAPAANAAPGAEPVPGATV